MTQESGNKPIVVWSGSHASASLLKAMLEEAGISTTLWDEASSSIVPLSLHVRVVVDEKDLEKAQPIIQEYVRKCEGEESS